MARGDSTAQSGETAGLNNANTFGANAQGLYSTVVPQLSEQAANPAGYNPADLARMETGAQQSAGGAEAGAVGQGGLLAARTRNAGGPAAAVAESAREASQGLAKNALGIQTANAGLKEKQRESALSGLTGLTGMETGASNQALGAVASNSDANTNAVNASWDGVKDILDPTLGAYGQVQSAALRRLQPPGAGG